MLSKSRHRKAPHWGTIVQDSLSVVVMVLILFMMGIAASKGQQAHGVVQPVTQPTSAYDGRGYTAPDKFKLIIMQNPDCWIGVPGETCAPGIRTFWGQ